MKRKSNSNPPNSKRKKTSPNELRNLKIGKINELKEASLLICVQKIAENPNYIYNLMKDIEASNPIIQDFLKNYEEIRRTKFNNIDVNILTEPSDDIYIKKKNETINRMIAYSGILNDLTTIDINNWKINKPPIVSYKDHKNYFTEPLHGEFACMHNDKNSNVSYCLAQKHHGVTLKVGPSYKGPGICIYCERFLISYIFEFSKKKNSIYPRVINRYRYHVGLPGEYKREYMLSQITPKQFGVIHYYPKFKREAYIPMTFKKTWKNREIKVRGLQEMNTCFFQNRYI